MPEANVQPCCIVTGLSGAGKSTALRVFEDMNFFTVDGLPASLAAEMIVMMQRPSMAHFKGIALGMDIRQSGFREEIGLMLDNLTSRGIHPVLLFVTAETNVLIHRYAQTRRPHPLEKEGLGLEACITSERSRLRQLKEQADFVIDTSNLSIHDLRRMIQRRWSGSLGRIRGLRVNVISFGFKYGVPKEADMVFDLRFLQNPYFVEELRSLCGKDQKVVDYVFASPVSKELLKKIKDFSSFTLRHMEAEGRYRVSIALGCTGGRHRSVAFAEDIAQFLKQEDYAVSLEHRHLELG